MELVNNGHALSAYNRNQCIDVFCFKPFEQLIRHVNFLNHFVFIYCAYMKRIDPGRLAKDSPGGRIKVLNQLRTEGNQSAIGIVFGVQQAFKPIADANESPIPFCLPPGRLL